MTNDQLMYEQSSYFFRPHPVKGVRSFYMEPIQNIRSCRQNHRAWSASWQSHNHGDSPMKLTCERRSMTLRNGRRSAECPFSHSGDQANRSHSSVGVLAHVYQDVSDHSDFMDGFANRTTHECSAMCYKRHSQTPELTGGHQSVHEQSVTTPRWLKNKQRSSLLEDEQCRMARDASLRASNAAVETARKRALERRNIKLLQMRSRRQVRQEQVQARKKALEAAEKERLDQLLKRRTCINNYHVNINGYTARPVNNFKNASFPVSSKRSIRTPFNFNSFSSGRPSVAFGSSIPREICFIAPNTKLRQTMNSNSVVKTIGPIKHKVSINMSASTQKETQNTKVKNKCLPQTLLGQKDTNSCSIHTEAMNEQTLWTKEKSRSLCYPRVANFKMYRLSFDACDQEAAKDLTPRRHIQDDYHPNTSSQTKSSVITESNATLLCSNSAFSNGKYHPAKFENREKIRANKISSTRPSRQAKIADQNTTKSHKLQRTIRTIPQPSNVSSYTTSRTTNSKQGTAKHRSTLRPSHSAIYVLNKPSINKETITRNSVRALVREKSTVKLTEVPTRRSGVESATVHDKTQTQLETFEAPIKCDENMDEISSFNQESEMLCQVASSLIEDTLHSATVTIGNDVLQAVREDVQDQYTNELVSVSNESINSASMNSCARSPPLTIYTNTDACRIGQYSTNDADVFSNKAETSFDLREVLPVSLQPLTILNGQEMTEREERKRRLELIMSRLRDIPKSDERLTDASACSDAILSTHLAGDIHLHKPINLREDPRKDPVLPAPFGLQTTAHLLSRSTSTQSTDPLMISSPDKCIEHTADSGQLQTLNPEHSIAIRSDIVRMQLPPIPSFKVQPSNRANVVANLLASGRLDVRSRAATILLNLASGRSPVDGLRYENASNSTGEDSGGKSRIFTLHDLKLINRKVAQVMKTSSRLMAQIVHRRIHRPSATHPLNVAHYRVSILSSKPTTCPFVVKNTGNEYCRRLNSST
ncbi:hypothetical protein EG68_07960 [Paragonimus skrjabini miyazakii]|uniref:Uncharacterized protein n=1 Tax=Paragonimus skrjabini miyazakii TaxID=59628 RepID=A0A8S9YKH9_9TREM|nr:hypothetical protein EG68_07960 [Paragonimus skrjabini miyazakii]